MSSTVTGVLKLGKKGSGGVLRQIQHSFRPQGRETEVPEGIIREYRLVEGAQLTGRARPSRQGRLLTDIESVCGTTPEQFQRRRPYTALTAIDPHERFNLAASGDAGMRIIDLIAPIGKGTRGMIVSPPKAGKTIMLERIANAIHAAEPATRIIALLIDERPEEVTHFRRAVKAEVLSSSNDQSIQEHIELVELTLAHIRTEIECGRDVVVLVDSLTRMGRAFNQKGSGVGRTLSGGLDAGALELPRRFFGLARNIEDGGSVTIIATALVDTGSRMDQLIFEEFKGTGNSEIILERSLAEAHIFPAINIRASGTRKEERLCTPQEVRGIGALRRMLADKKPKEAMEELLKLIKAYPTNEQLLAKLAPAK